MNEPGSTSRGDQTPEGDSRQSGWCGSTDWSLLLLAARSGAPGSTQALEQLCTQYRQPVYGYIWSHCRNRSDAEDLTQAFFAQFVKRDGLAGLEESKGRFRSYLLVCLKNLLANEWHKAVAEKRGGGIPSLSLDEMAAEESYFAAAPGLGPDKLYDQRWALTVVARALARLEAAEAKAGRGSQFACLHVFLTEDRVDHNYQAAGKALGKKRDAVGMAVKRLRERFGDALRAEVAATVTRRGQVEEEVRSLKAALRGL